MAYKTAYHSGLHSALLALHLAAQNSVHTAKRISLLACLDSWEPENKYPDLIDQGLQDGAPFRPLRCAVILCLAGQKLVRHATHTTLLACLDSWEPENKYPDLIDH